MSSTDNRWFYENVLSIHQSALKDNFDQAMTGRIPTDEAGRLPATDDSPYRGIVSGASLALDLELQDMYGNRVGNKVDDPSLPVGYYDEIPALTTWPGTGADYTISLKDDQPALTVTLTFTTEQYQYTDEETKETAVQLAGKHLEVLQRVYYQLLQEDFTVYLTSSLDKDLGTTSKNLSGSLKQTIFDYVVSCYLYLESFYSSGVYDDTAEVICDTLEVPIAFAPETTDNIANLTVQVVFSRDEALVLEVFRETTNVQSASSTIGPRYDSGGTDNYSLRQFSAQFETAFNGIKVTAGEKSPLQTSREPRKVWFVDFTDTGYQVAIQQDQRFYAMIPLSGQLYSRSQVPIVSYSDYKQLVGESDAAASLAAAASAYDFRSIDLDAWLKDYLEMIDLLLSPAYAVPGYLAAPEEYEKIVTAKMKLAQFLARRVASILEKDLEATEAENARQALLERLLVELSAAYRIDSMILVPFSVNQESRTLPPRLSGKLVTNNTDNQKNKSYTFKEAQIPLSDAAGVSHGAFLFDVKPEQETEQELFTLDLSYQISAIEHEIADVTGGDGYRDSTWLRFILPFTSDDSDKLENVNTDLGITSIPVPLLSYPDVPVLLSQEAISAISHSPVLPGDSLEEKVQKVKAWDYEFIYHHKPAAQDRIYLSVDFNVNEISDLTEYFYFDEDNFVTYLGNCVFNTLDEAQKATLYSTARTYATTTGEEQTTAREDIEELIGVLDSLKTELKDKLDNLGVKTKSHSYDALFTPLAQFSSVYSALKQDIVQLGSLEAEEGQAVMQVVHHLAEAVEASVEVAERSEQVLYPRSFEDREEYKVEIEKGTDGIYTFALTTLYQTSGPLFTVAVRKAGTTEEFSALTLQSRTDTDTVLSFPAAFDPFSEELEYRFQFTGRDILLNQSAWSGISVTRNEELDLEDLNKSRINPDFVYRTPLIHFPSKLIPGLRSQELIDLREEAADTVTTTLAHFLTLLFGSGNIKGQRIKITGRYAYNISGREDSLITFIPVFLIPSHTFADENLTAFTGTIQQQLDTWFDTNQPSRNNGAYYFNLSVYSGVNQEMAQPILELENLRFLLTLT